MPTLLAVKRMERNAKQIIVGMTSCLKRNLDELLFHQVIDEVEYATFAKRIDDTVNRYFKPSAKKSRNQFKKSST